MFGCVDLLEFLVDLVNFNRCILDGGVWWWRVDYKSVREK